eukprot:365365-Chlamydomonas_euryale.AAC.5
MTPLNRRQVRGRQRRGKRRAGWGGGGGGGRDGRGQRRQQRRRGGREGYVRVVEAGVRSAAAQRGGTGSWRWGQGAASSASYHRWAFAVPHHPAVRLQCLIIMLCACSASLSCCTLATPHRPPAPLTRARPAHLHSPQVQREIAIHSSLSHPHIITFVSCAPLHTTSSRTEDGEGGEGGGRFWEKKEAAWERRCLFRLVGNGPTRSGLLNTVDSVRLPTR